jgi:transcriptional regulator with XRE-family HTH domain
MIERRPTIRSKWLGQDLRRARQGADLSIADVGKTLDWPASKVSRIENGLVKAHWLDVQTLLDLYRIDESNPSRAALVELAKSARQKGWWHAYGKTLNHPFADLLSIEPSARRICTYQIQSVEGLLQVREYATALTAGSRVWEDEAAVETFVDVRMARQAILSKEEPVQLRVILGEGALRQVVGDAEVMRVQLMHLVEMGRRPNVMLQILPYSSGVSTGMSAPFVTLELSGPGALEVVYLEHLTGGLYIEDEAEVRRYMLAFEHLRASALPTAQSIKMIAEMAKELG